MILADIVKSARFKSKGEWKVLKEFLPESKWQEEYRYNWHEDILNGAAQ